MLGNRYTKELKIISQQIAEKGIRLGEIRAQLNASPSTSEYITCLVFGISIGLLVGVGIGVCFAGFFF